MKVCVGVRVRSGLIDCEAPCEAVLFCVTVAEAVEKKERVLAAPRLAVGS